MFGAVQAEKEYQLKTDNEARELGLGVGGEAQRGSQRVIDSPKATPDVTCPSEQLPWAHPSA